MNTVRKNGRGALLSNSAFVLDLLLTAVFFFLQIAPPALVGGAAAQSLLGVVKTVCAVGVFLVTAAILVSYRIHVAKPIRALRDAETTLILKDMGSLSIAISELAGGNLTVQAASSAHALVGLAGGEAHELIGLYNAMESQIREAILDINSVTGVSCKRLCYVGADSFREGKKCGEIMGELLKGKGQVAVFLNSLTITGHNLRRKGFQNEIAKRYPEIRVVEIREEHEDIEQTHRAVVEILQNWPSLNGIYICEGSTPSGAAKAVSEAGKTGAVAIVTHDLADPTMHSLASGVITATLSQNPYAQGYDPPIHLYNYLVTGSKPVISRMLTSMEVITRENYRHFWNERDGAILSEKEAKMLAVPVKNNRSRSLKIAVILPDDTLFWKPVAEGARAAIEALRAHGVEGNCLVPDALRGKDWSARAFISVIDKLVQEGYTALSLPIFDRALIPYLNSIVDAGVSVATLNAEPESFRGMVDAVATHAQNLFRFSANLASGSHEASQATGNISATMKTIFTGTKRQRERLSETDEALKSLRANIEQIQHESNESSAAARETMRTAQAGHDTVEQSNESMQSLKLASEKTKGIIQALTKHTVKIQDIVAIIEDIATQTNVLAINAAIQAARAGTQGKGFTVVATEIRELAEQSAKATGDIRGLIKTILGGVEEVTESMGRSMDDVQKSAESSDKAQAALHDIMGASGDNQKKIQIIDGAVKDMQKLSGSVKSAMESLESLTNENTAAIEAISRSIEEMNQEVAEISRMAQLFADMSRSQEDLVSQFELVEKKDE
jgi:methyl-accepting chemotaxis protein